MAFGFISLLGNSLAHAGSGSSKFIPTFVIYYGGGPALVAADAPKLAKFDLIDTDRFRYDDIGLNTWQAIKSINPNVQVYLYLIGPEVSNSHDSYAALYLNNLGRYNVSRGHPMGSLNGNHPELFLLNFGGGRIYSVPYSNPLANQFLNLMDFGSLAYQSYWLTGAKADIIDQPWVADGIFADNCLTFSASGGYSGTPAKYPSNSAWSSAMNSFVSAIAAGLHGYGQKLWCNKGDSRVIEGKAVWLALDSGPNPPDVLLEEGAFAVSWGSPTQFYPEANWKNQIDAMAAMRNTKVAMLSHTQLSDGQTGTDNWGRPVTFGQSLWYSLGSFLLGKNDVLGNAYFAFLQSDSYNSIQWHDEYDKVNLGFAVGPYAVANIDSVNIYGREFEKGYVYVNPTASDVAWIALPQPSRELTRANMSAPPNSIPVVTGISLNGHHAAILLKTVPSPAPSPSPSPSPQPDTIAPSVPTGLEAVAVSSTQINLSWNASTDDVGVRGYYVYLNDVALTTTTALSYQHTGLTPGQVYKYRVSAYDAVPNHSAWTATPVSVAPPLPDTTAPSVPTGLVGTAVSSSQINLSWNPSTDNVDVKGYHVYLNDVSLATTTTTSFSHTGLTAGTTYNYRVSAYDAVPNHSAWTATPVAVTTPAPPPPPPPLGYLPVIPGQAGYGMQTSAGRGGEVYKVNNLNASGAGSLRACTDASGPRVCVFEVSGSIDLGGGSLNIYNPFLTIAGQTAPAPGISIINASFQIITHDVLVQHIRSRGGLAPDRRLPLAIDNYQGTAYNIVVDHVSMAWSTDDLVQTWWGAHDISWSHVLATGELRNTEVYFDADGKVMITDSIDYNILMRDSALITGYQRMPMASANPFVFVNNIVYNWGGVATQLMRPRVTSGGEFVITNNHYRTGPLNSQAWVQKPIHIRDYVVPGFHVHLNGNYAPDFVVNQQWDLVQNESGYLQTQMQVSAPGAWPTGLVAKSAANGGIFDSVLNDVGAFPLSRDSLDARLVSDARNRTGGYVTSTTFPTLAQNNRALTIPANANGDDDGDGYTNLEEWLHCMAAQVEGRTCSAQTPPSNTLAITSFQPTSDGTNGYYKILYTGTPTRAHVYFDTDRNAGTGYPVSDIGANYMVELGSGYGNLYSYSGTGGGWGWTSVKAVTYTNTGGVANITVARVDLGSPGSVDVVGSIQDAGTTLYTTKVNQAF